MPIAPKGTWYRTHRVGVAAETLRDVVRCVDRWVVVGENGSSPLILTVEDSVVTDVEPAFTTRSAGGSDVLWGIDYLIAQNLAVAVGDNGVVEESTDRGQTWSSSNLAGSPQLYAVVANPDLATSRFIAVGVDEIWGNSISTGWSQRWSGSQTWRSVAYRFGAGFVAVGDGGFAAHSPTGAAASWTAPYSMAISDLKCVAANQTYFLATDNSNFVYRSSTGLNGSWTILANLDGLGQAIFPLDSTLEWAATSITDFSAISNDDGATWTENDQARIVEPVVAGYHINDVILGAGANGTVFFSEDQNQETYVAPEQEIQTPEASFLANADMSGDAVRRLVTQFRSGRG